MTKALLCFGDSNTRDYVPGSIAETGVAQTNTTATFLTPPNTAKQVKLTAFI